MLTITPTARRALRAVQPAAGEDGGLRIAKHDLRRDDPDASFRLTMSQRPRRVDTVVEQKGARVFLGPEAAKRLRDRELDARRADDGRVEFVVRRAR